MTPSIAVLFGLSVDLIVCFFMYLFVFVECYISLFDVMSNQNVLVVFSSRPVELGVDDVGILHLNEFHAWPHGRMDTGLV